MSVFVRVNLELVLSRKRALRNAYIIPTNIYANSHVILNMCELV